MESIASVSSTQQAERIPYVTAGEAYALMKTALERLLALVETLSPADWSQPTACTQWTVREMVAHQAGSYASGTSYREMIRQYSAIPKKGQLPEDATNALQVRERANCTPQELIAEIREKGPTAIHNWAYGFGFAKRVTIPHPVGGMLSLRHLMWVIHSRDPWMHRLDICRATGRPFEQSAGHDRRIAELVMLDAAKAVKRKLGPVSILFDLTGPSGGAWQVGQGEPSAAVQMDVLDFNIFASGRFNYEEACRRARFSGDTALADRVFKNLLVLY